MNKIIPLSLVAVASLYAAEIELSPIGVESTYITEVSQKAQVSADLAEALNLNVPSIDMSRRSGIANDIFIRGQKRDNISVEVDGTKVCGACPNRMDPPVSHVLASQIQDIEVIEGPYDVETFGTMSGGLKITTKKPQKGFHGDITGGFGSWGYQKLGTTLTGGNDTVRVLFSVSKEKSGQYEDGDGNTLAEQTKLKAPTMNQYQTKYEDMDAYDKKSLMAKVFVSVTDDQELQLSMTKNRSDDILYPGTPMDAVYDNSNIYSVAYDIKNISDVYTGANLQYYYSEVDHPMDTRYRNNGVMMYMTNQLQTTMQGLKLKNDLDINGYKVLLGLDGSKRTWAGNKYATKTSNEVRLTNMVSLTHTTTENEAIFAKVDKSFGDLDVTFGARYDMTDITPTDRVKYQTNDYNALNANLFTAYNLSKQDKIFLGIGRASRVPDARELYLTGTSSNQYLDQVTNTEMDLGYELQNDMMKFKIKGFYSILDNYIYLQKGSKFTNIDAKVYGAELSASYFATDELTFDMGASYKRGKKDHALVGQSGTNLADIAPLRGTLGANYEYMNDSFVTIEGQASASWNDYDAENGEQALGSWAILNMKVDHSFTKNINLTIGVNNIFDKTYAQSNTYVDLTLLSAGVETMLLNEPGRYLYTNLTYKF